MPLLYLKPGFHNRSSVRARFRVTSNSDIYFYNSEKYQRAFKEEK